MKIVFIYSFLKLRDPLDDTDGLPLSTPMLVSNVKDKFPKISFSQIDLNMVMRELAKTDMGFKLKVERFDNYIDKIISLRRKKVYSGLRIKSVKNSYADNRVPQNYFVPTETVYDKAKSILFRLDKESNLDLYDHYFLTVYKPDELDIVGMFLTAMYLKKNYPFKKIVVGGLHNFTDFLKNKLDLFPYIDSLVYGYAEGCFGEIMDDLKRDRLKKIYKSFFSYKDILRSFPDYDSFKQLNCFRMTNDEIKKRYFLDFTPSSFQNLILIPYEFSVGCFWNKCAYCGSSGDDFHQKLYMKPVSEVIRDIKEMKKRYSSDTFIFYNQNFNQTLSYAKSLLKEIIKHKLNIKWMDMFNIVNIDEEMIDLLSSAGCIRMDIGVSILNPSLQKFYGNILRDNSHLIKLKKISEKGIWTDVNIITNMPYDFKANEDIEIIKPYFKYIDSCSLNNFRLYSSSDIFKNPTRYKIKKIDEAVKVGAKIAPLSFVEKNFPFGIEKRKKIFAKNFMLWEKVLYENKIVSNLKLFPLITALYKEFSFENKNIIKKYVLNYYKRVKLD
ncbi:MAG: radical SAM protein [Elusimicrobiales bacterium]